jgi:hypothetical protein
VQERREFVWLAVLMLMLAAIAGCQSQQPTVQREDSDASSVAIQPTATQDTTFSSPFRSPVDSPTSWPTPTFPRAVAGKAVIRGALISSTTQRPVSETPIYLTPGIGEQGDQLPPLLTGPQEQDVRGYTDEKGWFAINDISPGTYYMIIWAPLNWIVLEKNGTPVQLNLQPDQVVDLGEMIIDWP